MGWQPVAILGSVNSWPKKGCTALGITASAAALLFAAPAVAGCDEYIAGDTSRTAPRARICLHKRCETTTLLRICSTASWVATEYANGWHTGKDDTGDRYIKRDERSYTDAEVTCQDLDNGGACDTF